jgi:4-carboxymuconolactone decarboxylase
MPEPVRIKDIPENELTPEQAKVINVFDAIRAGEEPVLDNERERAVYDLARIAMAPGAGSDEVFARAERLLGRNGIAEVLALLGYYSSVAMGVKLHRVPVPT